MDRNKLWAYRTERVVLSYNSKRANQSVSPLLCIMRFYNTLTPLREYAVFLGCST